MTHTLHRTGNIEDLCEDYVVLLLQARGFNREGNEHKMGQVWEIFSRHEADIVNFGTPVEGNSSTNSMNDLKKTTTAMAHAVFIDREKLKDCLRELKEKDLGVSVVVSGIFGDTAKVCSELGLSPHTVHHSLGIHGRVDKLPEDNILEITTMCGHALVSPNLINHLIKKIGEGKLSHKEAAKRHWPDQAKLSICNYYHSKSTRFEV